jgi:hypothetical protein
MKIVFCLILLTACQVAQSQQHQSITTIEYSTLSRGGYNELVTITHDSIRITIQELRGDEPVSYTEALQKGEWNQLIGALKLVNLNELGALPSPTMKRAYDGALHSSLTITTNQQTVSHAFDDTNPHQNMVPLFKAIMQIKDRVVAH